MGKEGINFDYVMNAYHNLNLGDHFFFARFRELWGVDYVREMIKERKSSKIKRLYWHK